MARLVAERKRDQCHRVVSIRRSTPCEWQVYS